MERKTKTRALIRKILQKGNRPLLPQEILETAKEMGHSIGIATIYRNLKAFEESGFLKQVALPGHPARFELAQQEHHHHFLCRTCNRVFDIPGCSLNQQDLEMHLMENFKVTHHEITLFGQCDTCQLDERAVNEANA